MSNSVNEIAGILGTSSAEGAYSERYEGAIDALVQACAHRAWTVEDELVRIQRMCSEAAHAQNVHRTPPGERTRPGATCITVVREYCAGLDASPDADPAEAWVEFCAGFGYDPRDTSAAGGRPRGTRSDAAQAFRGRKG